MIQYVTLFDISRFFLIGGRLRGNLGEFQGQSKDILNMIAFYSQKNEIALVDRGPIQESSGTIEKSAYPGTPTCHAWVEEEVFGSHVE